jgi:hypothetical protein
MKADSSSSLSFVIPANAGIQLAPEGAKEKTGPRLSPG